VTITFKRGDTIRIPGQLSDADGLLDLTGYDLACWAVGGTSTVVLTIAAGVALGSFEITAADTSGWTLGAYALDIRYGPTGGDSLSTATFSILIEREITAR